MNVTHYQFGGVKVKVIDKSSHDEREKRLVEPLNTFYRQARKDIEMKELTLNEINALHESTGICFPVNDGEAKAEVE